MYVRSDGFYNLLESPVALILIRTVCYVQQYRLETLGQGDVPRNQTIFPACKNDEIKKCHEAKVMQNKGIKGIISWITLHLKALTYLSCDYDLLQQSDLHMLDVLTSKRQKQSFVGMRH